MSYRIEYQWTSWKLTAGPDTGGVDRFVVAIEGGDNNLRDAVTGKRARSWEVCMLGSAEQVLKQAVYFAGACEGGSLKPGSRDCSPEAYIRRIRRLIEEDTPPARGCWYPSVRVAEAHPLAVHATQLDLRDRARAAVWRMVRASGTVQRAAQPDLRLRRQVPRPARLAAGSRRRPAGELSPTLFPLSDSSGAFLEPRVHGGSREAVVWAYSHLWNQVAMRA